MENEKTCPSCHKKVVESWRYCRYCGAAQTVTSKPVIKEIEKIEVKKEVKEKVVFDKKLYFSVLSTRSERSELIKEKKKLLEDIASLLEQVEAGVVSREYALPKIKELKEKKSKVSEKEEKFKDLPSQLPVEILIDQLNDAEARLDKIADLKNDPAITKDAIKEAKKRAQDSIILLREEYSIIAAHLRTWYSEVKNELESERKILEQLYIRMKTGELTEESYEEKKAKKVGQVTKLSNISEMLKNML